jgi:hypothetical protein
MMEKVDIEFYKFAVGAFMRTERFRSFSPRQRKELDSYLQKLDSIGTGQQIARLEDQAKTDPDVADALDRMMMQLGQGGAPQEAIAKLRVA